jgi:AcrR family transcriptional regulator
MAEPRRTRADRRTARTTSAILDSAERLFRELGYHATTIEQIAQGADVAVGTVYFHFASKEGLYLALVERALDVNERYMAEAYDPDLSALEQVIKASDAYLRFHLDHPGFFRMVALRVLDVPPSDARAAAERRLADRVEVLVDAVADAIRRAANEGDLDVEDPKLASRFLWGAWNGVLALHLREDRLALSKRELRAAIDLGLRLMLRGILTEQGRKRATEFL